MLHCNFVGITLWHGCSPVNLLDIFRRPSYKNTSWRATSSSTVCCYKWIEIKHHYSRKEYSVECKVSECEDINTWKSVLCVNENVLLIFPAPCIAGSSVKIRINSYFLCCLRRLHRKQVWKWIFKFIFLSLFEIGTGRVNKFINKVVIIYKQIFEIHVYRNFFRENTNHRLLSKFRCFVLPGYKLLGIYLSFRIASVNDLPEQLPWFCLEVYLGG